MTTRGDQGVLHLEAAICGVIDDAVHRQLFALLPCILDGERQSHIPHAVQGVQLHNPAQSTHPDPAYCKAIATC